MNAAIWITAWSTLGLFLAAVVAGIVAWRTFRAEHDRGRRAQAERIGAWTATRSGHTFGLCLLNDSSLPVTDFEVLVAHRMDEAEAEHYQVLPPGFFFAPSVGPVEGKYGHFGRPSPMDRDTLELEPTTVHTESSNVKYFSFVDATGQRWKRNLRAKPGEAMLARIDKAELHTVVGRPGPG
jgi:hypothetical protein